MRKLILLAVGGWVWRWVQRRMVQGRASGRVRSPSGTDRDSWQ